MFYVKTLCTWEERDSPSGHAFCSNFEILASIYWKTGPEQVKLLKV